MSEIIEYLVYERINKMVPNSEFLKYLNQMFNYKLHKIDISNSNILDFLDLPDMLKSLERVGKVLRNKEDYLSAQVTAVLGHVDYFKQSK